jgi:DNA-binding NarL/FixJ family response regulator
MNALRLLIVDDMAQVRRELRTILPLAGEDIGTSIEIVGEAADGREAIWQAGVQHPDVVLMDLEMAGMDGYAATHEIKSLHPSIQIIALTVHGDPASRIRALQSGVDVFIEKGVPVAEIIRAIQPIEKKDNL